MPRRRRIGRHVGNLHCGSPPDWSCGGLTPPRTYSAGCRPSALAFALSPLPRQALRAQSMRAATVSSSASHTTTLHANMAILEPFELSRLLKRSLRKRGTVQKAAVLSVRPVPSCSCPQVDRLFQQPAREFPSGTRHQLQCLWERVSSSPPQCAPWFEFDARRATTMSSAA
jgi:hypothetical protein